MGEQDAISIKHILPTKCWTGCALDHVYGCFEVSCIDSLESGFNILIRCFQFCERALFVLCNVFKCTIEKIVPLLAREFLANYEIARSSPMAG